MAKPSRTLAPLLVLALLAVSAFSLPASASMTPAQTQPQGVKPPAPATKPSVMPEKKPSLGAGVIPMYETLYQKIADPDQTPGNFLYYTPAEIRAAYNVTSLLDAGYTGAGVVISIVDAYGDPYIQGELNNFSKEFGLPLTTINQVCVDGPCNGTLGIVEGWNTEIALDVEWAHAMAPGATINLFIGSNSSLPLYNAVEAAVLGTNGNGTFVPRPSIISMSWGEPENDIGDSASSGNYPWLDQIFQQAAADGITLFASSGDYGAYDQTFNQTSPYGGASYPSTDPYVTGVGGTSLYLSTTSGSLENISEGASASYGYETAWSWNDAYELGTGGGYSTLFAQPSWQAGPGVTENGERGAPDVAWDADIQTGVAVYITGGVPSPGFYIVGGTSVGSPSWAGSMALIDQKAGHSLGFIDPELYAILDNPSEYAAAFHDITVGNNNPNQAGPGWDPLTGIGSPNLGELASYLTRPSTALSVSASSSVGLGQSAAYGALTVDAVVAQGASTVTTGVVTATLDGPTGHQVTTLAMSYDPTEGLWTGTYNIVSGDPAGMWTATVRATSRSYSGAGSTTFSVGDGISIYLPYSGPGDLFGVGATIPVSAVITNLDGTSNVTSGSFEAVFRLDTASGPLEGSAPLTYNSTSEVWQGSFAVTSSMSQGPWVLSVQGTDSVGNEAAPAYSWLNVGLPLVPGDIFTNEPTYLSGQSIIVYAFAGGGSGTFQALLQHDGQTVKSAQMSLLLDGIWFGVISTRSVPAGFYTVTVTGNDGQGDLGSAETIVRIASTALRSSLKLSVKSVSLTSDEAVTVTSTARYPNGTALSVGSVEAFVTLELADGEGFAAWSIPLTYQSATGDFVGTTSALPASAHLNYAGTYYVDVVAFDPLGDYGVSQSLFTVRAVPTTTTVKCSASGAAVGGEATCTATVTARHYVPSGTVSWSSEGLGSVSFSSPSCTLALNGSCSVAVSGLSAGSLRLKVEYGGGAYFDVSVATRGFTVDSVTVGCSGSPTVGEPTTCTATVQGYSPTGTVKWTTGDAGSFSSTQCTLVRGECQVSFTPSSPGTFSMVASYSGNAHNPAASGSAPLDVSS